MSAIGWDTLAGGVFQSAYRVGEVLRTDGRTALMTGSTNSGQSVLISAVRVAPDEVETYRRRFLEAKFLHHPNLLQVYEAGRTVVRGGDVAFAVMEPVEVPLTSANVLDAPMAWELARQLADALSYLHSENLVHCALREEAVWRSGSLWKLGDFQQLRLPGRARMSETRSLMGRMPEVPPEAFEGLVTPAWDVWSLGVTLSKVLKRSAAAERGQPLPEPFESIVDRCLDANPATRITVPELVERLAQAYPGQTSVPAPAAAPAAEVELPAAAEVAQDVPGWYRSGVQPARSTLGLSPLTRTEEPADPAEAGPGWRLTAWLPFAIAGALVGVLLTVFAFRQDGVVPAKRVAPSPPLQRQSDSPPAAKPDPTVAPGAPDPKSGSVTPAAVSAKPRIESLLAHWAASVRAKDVNGQMATYAPIVDQFYGRRQLNARDLRAEKARQFSAISNVRRFEIADLRVRQVNAELALATFRKTWDFGTFSGSEEDEMVVRFIQGEWRIASERPRKLYWVKRSKLSR